MVHTLPYVRRKCVLDIENSMLVREVERLHDEGASLYIDIRSVVFACLYLCICYSFFSFS